MGLLRALHHLWLDSGDVHRALGKDALDRLAAQVRDSERRHTGEICVCVEASLPLRYQWRHLRHRTAFADLAHERALELFAEQRVWDTEHNNGVLIYVLPVEHRVELIADRGIVPPGGSAQWQELMRDISTRFAAGRLEDGISQAIDAVGNVLQGRFPALDGEPHAGASEDGELPDRPVIL